MSAGQEPVLVLTTHELAVLEEAHARGLGAAEELAEEADTHDEIPDDGRAEQARWSLTGRGLLGPDGDLIPGSELGLLVQTLLDVRLGASALVVVERLLGEGQRDLRLLHLMAEGGVVEDVHPQGLHGFDLAVAPDDLVAAVTAMVVPPDAEAGTGTAFAVGPEAAADLPDLLHRPTVLAELTLVRPHEEEGSHGHLVALGPGGCFVARRGAGQAELRFAPVDPGWVARQVSDWVMETVLPMDAGQLAGGRTDGDRAGKGRMEEHPDG